MSLIKADAITASSGTNTNIAITGKGTGKLKLGDGELLFPDSDGAAGTAIVTNGSGTLSFAATGKVVQVVNTSTGAVATTTGVIPNDDTIVQSSEGGEFLTLAITPTSATNKLIIKAFLNLSPNGTSFTFSALFQDSTASAISASSTYHTANELNIGHIQHYMTAGTTSETTFKIRVGKHSAGTTTLNGVSGARKFGGVLISSMTITEISA